MEASANPYDLLESDVFSPGSSGPKDDRSREEVRSCKSGRNNSKQSEKKARLRKLKKARKKARARDKKDMRHARGPLPWSDLHSSDASQAYAAMCSIRHAYAMPAPGDDTHNPDLIEAVPVIVRAMANSSVEMQTEAIAALANISSCSRALSDVFAKSGAMELAAAMITKAAKGHDISVAVPTDLNEGEQKTYRVLAVVPANTASVLSALELVGFVASSSVEIRDTLLLLRVVDPIADLACALAPGPGLVAASSALRALCSGAPHPDPATLRPAARALPRLLHCDLEEVFDSAIDFFQAALTLDIVPTSCIMDTCPIIARLVGHPTPSIRHAAVRASECLVANRVCAEVMIEQGLLHSLGTVLASRAHTDILREACAPLTFICMMGLEGKQAILDAELAPSIAKLLRHSDPEVQRVALATASGFVVDATPEQIHTFLIEANVVRPVCHLLQHKEVLIVHLALDTIHTFLIAEGSGRNGTLAQLVLKENGLQVISKLRVSQEPHLRDKAREIVENFFDERAVELAAQLGAFSF